MNVLLQRLIRNWERSGQGDGGIHVLNDGDELFDHEEPQFGQLKDRSCGALLSLVLINRIFCTSGKC